MISSDPWCLGEPSAEAEALEHELTAALEEYLAEAEAGRRPSRAELLGRHPRVAAQLAHCLDSLELLEGSAAQLRELPTEEGAGGGGGPPPPPPPGGGREGAPRAPRPRR
ncbi:MAG: hypothetical protein RMJ52_04790, partial [Gemmataceae bacterium]|nr:hypothetical protein [Gemmataceae bacterium]